MLRETSHSRTNYSEITIYSSFISSCQIKVFVSFRKQISHETLKESVFLSIKCCKGQHDNKSFDQKKPVTKTENKKLMHIVEI